MQIKMKEAGESPEFGPYEIGDEIDETRASLETMKRLVERRMAEEVRSAEFGVRSQKKAEVTHE
jgi:hypoxanthine phosphoribosyltransferase